MKNVLQFTPEKITQVLGHPSTFSGPSADLDCLWWVILVAVKTAAVKLTGGNDDAAVGARQ
jgi:hypothetical protein